uniref:Serine-threonine protein kinase n=1 Tax=Sorangium cellulosum TaxID=56 RepID=Q4U436_SORCE|nr:serine-threonine protein kinase [Sorangium cellulosum]CAI43943.1 putative serine-threonine protein kinase [Sorangium cellulosum]
MSDEGARRPDGSSVPSTMESSASVAPSRLGPGDVVGQRWQLDELLKKGGMGRVFRATDIRLLEPVALKLMDPAIVGTERARARFLREAQTAAKLRGPNVVQVLDFNVDAATQVPYIAMELLRGEDLAERIARGPLSYDETVAILAGVCSAIGRAHRMDIFHRDLKPANVFLVEDDDGPLCKVLDFGIVKLADVGLGHQGTPQTDAGSTLGTVSYMSPEQIADARRVDHRADLWALGVIAYECMTGRRPFRGDSLFELVHEICYGVPVVPSRLADVPGGFDGWFARATHRDRERRFASARELLDALRALAGRSPQPDVRMSSVPPPPDPSHAQSWASDANQIDINALKDLTFKNAVVREFLDSANKHFVSGSKGLGKTLLLTYKRSVLGEIYLASNGRERRQSAVQFIPEGRPYLDLMGDLGSVDQHLIDLMSGLYECKRLWSFSFRLSIVSYQSALAGAGDARDLAALPRGLRGLLDGRPVEPTMVVKELLSMTVGKINQVIDAMEGPLERRLRSLHSGVFIFVDKLDQALRRLPRAAWIHMQAGMIEAAWDLMNANRHVKVFATIREEAFSAYESDIKTNLFGATSTLRYAKHELFELLEKLTYYYERLPLREFIHLDVVSAGRSARGEATFDFLYRHTLGRPRDLVILASEISRNRRALDERTFTRIVQDTSAGLLVANVFDEMRVFLEVLCHRDKRARFLGLLPSDVLTHEDLVDVWCGFHGVDRAYFDAHGRDADDVYHPFRELFECGLLGVIGGDPAAERKVQRFRQPHDAVVGSRHALPRSPYYLLHPSLRALIEPLPGGGRFRAMRHVVIGHGEPWPRHWDLVVDVQRELFKRPDADEEIGEAVFSLLDHLAADVADGEGEGAARRAIAASPTLARLGAHLDRIRWDDLHLALLELFPAARREEAEPTDRVEVAMLLIDIVRSTHMISKIGDTRFVGHLQRLRRVLLGSTNPRLLKGIGDGYLAVYPTMTRALDAARVLRDAVDDPAELRLVLHWGAVRMSDHDVIGREVHRLFRIEAVTEEDRAAESSAGITLAQPGRVRLSRPALAALPDAERAGFRRAGAFRLEGFDEPEPIWVEIGAGR